MRWRWTCACLSVWVKLGRLGLRGGRISAYSAICVSNSVARANPICWLEPGFLGVAVEGVIDAVGGAAEGYFREVVVSAFHFVVAGIVMGARALERL